MRMRAMSERGRAKTSRRNRPALELGPPFKGGERIAFEPDAYGEDGAEPLEKYEGRVS